LFVLSIVLSHPYHLVNWRMKITCWQPVKLLRTSSIYESVFYSLGLPTPESIKRLSPAYEFVL